MEKAISRCRCELVAVTLFNFWIKKHCLDVFAVTTQLTSHLMTATVFHFVKITINIFKLAMNQKTMRNVKGVVPGDDATESSAGPHLLVHGFGFTALTALVKLQLLLCTLQRQ